jgi:hypothetical protein
VNKRPIEVRQKWVTALLGVIPLSIAVGCGSTHAGGNGVEGGGSEHEPVAGAAGNESGGDAGNGAGGTNSHAGTGGGGAGAGGTGGTISHAGTGGSLTLGGFGGDAGESAQGGEGGETLEEPCGAIDEGLVIATTAVPDAELGGAYEVALVPLGGTRQQYSFTLESGTLPDGLVLEPTGRLHGVSTVEGSFDSRCSSPIRINTRASGSSRYV